MDLDLIQVFNDTRSQSNTKYITNTIDSIKSVKVYTEDSNNFKTKRSRPNILTTYGGTVSTAYKCTKFYKRVAILNFANAFKPGGGVVFGGIAQEENICRCTNLYETLVTPQCKEEFYKWNNSTNNVATDRVIYSKDIVIFKDDVTYNTINMRTIDVITSPAPCCQLTDIDAYNIYVSRMKNFIGTAIDNNVDCIVLGAWGCGVFQQNPEIVAKAFADVLNDYGGYFKSIVFAFKSTSDTHNDDVRSIFDKVLKKNYRGGINV